MTRVKVVCIDSCRSCPFRIYYTPHQYRCGKVFEAGEGEPSADAATLGRLIPYSACMIPPWCPLPDAQKAENEVKEEKEV